MTYSVFHKNKSSLKKRFTSVFTTLAIIVLLIMAGPVLSVVVDVSTDSTYYKNGAENVTFIADVDIETDERIPVQNLTLFITGPTNKTCIFATSGQAVSGCGNLTITPVNVIGFGYADDTSFEMFGYGYGYGASGYGTENQTYGYGYGYGYATGYDSSGSGGELRYNITWNITAEGAGEGDYTADMDAFAQSGYNFRIYKDQTSGSFVIDQTAPSISSFSVSPSSPLLLQSVSISASVSDSLSGVNTKTVKVTKSSGSSTSASFSSPYTYTGTSVTGNYHVEILATDIAGNQANLTTTNAFSVDTGTSSGTTGGGSAAGATGLGTTAVSASYVSLVSNVRSGKATTISFSDQAAKDTGVSEIEILTTKDAQTVQVKVTKVSEPTGITVKVGGKVFGYLEIKSSGIDDSSLSKVKIKFQVPKTWLAENGVSADQVALSRYADNVWNELSTSKLSEDNGYVYFESESSGLSVFAVTTKAAVTTPTQPVPTTTVPTTPTQPVPTTTVKKPLELPPIIRKPGKTWATLLLGILLVVLLVLVAKAFHTKQQKPMVYNTTL